jgi:hypothetical protein
MAHRQTHGHREAGSPHRQHHHLQHRRPGQKRQVLPEHTAHTAQDTDTYQVFTIQTPTKTYIVRQKLNFPWSKPANIALGEDVKFTIQGNKMTILDDDQKQQKATIVKASITPSH